jgi:hypothetical protein
MQQANSQAFGFQQVANFRPNGSLSIAPLDPGSFGNLQSGGNFQPGNAAASTMSAFAGATGQPHFGARFSPGPLALGAQGGALGRGWASAGGECFTECSVCHKQLQQTAVHTEGLSGLSLCVLGVLVHIKHKCLGGGMHSRPGTLKILSLTPQISETTITVSGMHPCQPPCLLMLPSPRHGRSQHSKNPQWKGLELCLYGSSHAATGSAAQPAAAATGGLAAPDPHQQTLSHPVFLPAPVDPTPSDPCSFPDASSLTRCRGHSSRATSVCSHSIHAGRWVPP